MSAIIKDIIFSLYDSWFFNVLISSDIFSSSYLCKDSRKSMVFDFLRANLQSSWSLQEVWDCSCSAYLHCSSIDLTYAA